MQLKYAYIFREIHNFKAYDTENAIMLPIN